MSQLPNLPQTHPNPFRRWTVYCPVTVFMMFVACLVVGVMAFPSIPVQLMPASMGSGAISVWIGTPGGTPREMKEEVAKPCEELLRTIPGVNRIYSDSNGSRCRLRVSFDSALNLNSITADVRDRVDRAPGGGPAFKAALHGFEASMAAARDA